MADELWHTQEKWREYWPDSPPVMDGIVLFGVSEHPKIVETMDNVRTRTFADTMYAADEFRNMSPSERKEMVRMTAKAVNLLWLRTDAKHINSWGTKRLGNGSMIQYQTMAVDRDFLDRHPKLRKCVKLMFDFNKDRSISLMKLSPGECAALLYLMGSGLSDIDGYRNADPLPNEKKLDWDRWDSAVQFFRKLFTERDTPDEFLDKEVKEQRQAVNPVRIGLSQIMDSTDGGGGRLMEKYHLLAEAWEMACKGDQVTPDDLDQQALWVSKRSGKTVFTGRATFGGIDHGQWGEPDLTEEPTAEEAAAEKERIAAEKRAAEAKRQQDKLDEAKVVAEVQKPKLDQLAAAAAANAGKGANGKPLTSKQVQAQQTANVAAVPVTKLPPAVIKGKDAPADKKKGKGNKQPLKGGIG